MVLRELQEHGTGGPVLPGGVRGTFFASLPTLYLPLFLNDAVLEGHKSDIDMSRDLLRGSPSAGCVAIH